MNRSLGQLFAKLVEADREYTYRNQRLAELETAASEELMYVTKRKVLELAIEIMCILPDFKYTLDGIELGIVDARSWLAGVEQGLRFFRKTASDL